jgi:hypothetical protein
MREISMAYVTPAFVAEKKCVTRRDWKDTYAKSFEEGEHLAVFDRQKRFGGEQIGEMELAEKPYKENLSAWAGREEELYEMEGFAFMEDKNIVPQHAPLLKLAYTWVEMAQDMWVVPFNTLKVLPEAKKKYMTELEIAKARDRLFYGITGVRISDITPKGAYIRQVA